MAAKRTPKSRPTNMERIEDFVKGLPEAIRFDVEAWDNQPTFRVRNKNFVFTDVDATSLMFKLSKEEATAVIATEPSAEPAGYGLGKHGWVSCQIEPNLSDARWQEVAEWIETSYTIVAPKSLAKQVLARLEGSERS